MKNSHYVIKTPVGWVYGFDSEHQLVTHTDNSREAKQFETYERADAYRKYMDGIGVGFQRSASLIFTVEK